VALGPLRGERFEGLGDAVRRRRSVVGRLGEARHNHILELRRQRPPEYRRRALRRRRDVRADLRHRAHRAEDPLAGEQPVPDAAEGVEVRAVIDLATRGDLGSHERGGADDAVVLFGEGIAHVGQPEVDDLDPVDGAADSAEQDVRGLDVAMHEPDIVGVPEGVADVDQQARDALGIHRAGVLDQRLEIDAVEQLHHDVELAVVGDPKVVQADGVRGPELRGGAGLLGEAVRELAVRV